MADYKRVLPRDLFNEAKLLKCYGQVALKCEDGLAPKGLRMEVTSGDSSGFRIEQDENSGSLSVRNITLYLFSEAITLFVPLNSRGKYPLYARREGGRYDDEDLVFNDKGEFTEEFRTLVR